MRCRADDEHDGQAHHRGVACAFGGFVCGGGCGLLDQFARLVQQLGGLAVHAFDGLVACLRVLPGAVEGLQALAVVDAHALVRLGKLLHPLACVPCGQALQQLGGLGLDGGFFLFKGRPVALELCGILAAQQHALPLLHLHLEGDQHAGSGALVVHTGGHFGFVGGEGLVESRNAKQRGGQQKQQGCREHQGELEAQLHGDLSERCVGAGRGRAFRGP